MKNTAISKIFYNLANLLELKGENVFKIRAYRRAAQVIEHMPKELKVMLDEGEDLTKIPGIGEAIAKKSEELIRTGRLEIYETLKAQFPEGILDLMSIPGIGPKTAHRLATELDITSIDHLERAILEGKVSDLFRMGDKTSQNILRHIQSLRRKDQRIPIGRVLPYLDEILTFLGKLEGIKHITPAGSLRRFRETVGDVDIMGTADDPEYIINSFVTFPLIKEVIAKGPTKASVLLPPDLQVDLRIVDHVAFGSLLQYFTGSKEHNIALRTKAQKKGLKLSEYGITDSGSDRLVKFPTEEELYEYLGMQYIPPEIREDKGEIERAEEHTIPELVNISDVLGDFHVHSNWSDGSSSLEELANAAKTLGYKFIVVTDHSRGRGVSRGLTPERLKKQIEEIERLNSRLEHFHIFRGIEVDIRADGSLDMPESLLAELDIVIAAVHSSFQQSSETMTKRIISAIQNPYVHIIAHPTCRLIGEREPTDVDMEAVFKAALHFGKALEINAMPERLDMKDTHIFRARELGVKMAIGTDAHHTSQLQLMKFGISLARRGWCEKKHILNCLVPHEVLTFFKK